MIYHTCNHIVLQLIVVSHIRIDSFTVIAWICMKLASSPGPFLSPPPPLKKVLRDEASMESVRQNLVWDTTTFVASITHCNYSRVIRSQRSTRANNSNSNCYTIIIIVSCCMIYFKITFLHQCKSSNPGASHTSGYYL